MAPLLPFEELVNETQFTMDHSSRQEDACSDGIKAFEDCTLPDPRALLHVTNRRKGPVKKKSLVVVCNVAFPLHFIIFRTFGTLI